MNIRDSRTRWGIVSQLLHWLFAILLVVQVVLGLIDRALPLGPARTAVIGTHKSLGITVLVLAMIRLLWRRANPVPDPLSDLKPKAQALARFAQVMLYVLLFAIPLNGWLLASAHAYKITWFNLFPIPFLVSKNLPLFDVMDALHEALAILLGLIVALHVAAALRHHFVLKDETLRRMFPFARPAPSNPKPATEK
jgi:cytochrome b561